MEESGHGRRTRRRLADLLVAFPAPRRAKGNPRDRSDLAQGVVTRSPSSPFVCAPWSPPPFQSRSSAPPAHVDEPPAAPGDASPGIIPATRIPVDARGLALGVLATLAVVFALSWSRPFVVPLLLGIVIAYTLNPVVVWLEAIIVPVGTFIATWMTGRIARMNSAAIFVSLLFWGWLWGVWGVLLGIPIIVIVKVVSEHVEQLQPVDELLGH